MNEYELCHHGVKGMHWGVRRYQNKDGTLTARGKARVSQDAHAETTTNQSRKSMSNTELKSRIERLKLEKELKSLERDTVDDGKAFVKDVMTAIGKKTATQVGTGVAIFAIKSAFEGELDIKDAAKYMPKVKDKW